MKKTSGFRKFLPYLIAVVVFMAISMFYFKPQYEGLALRQSDVLQVEGMNGDIQAHIEEYGEHPQWAGRMFGGMPAYFIDFNYEGRLIKEAAGPLWFIGTPAAYLFLAMLGFFGMLLCFRVNPWLSLVGGIAYGLSTYFVIIIGVGHLTKMIALCYAPPLVGAVWLAYRRRRWAGAVLAGIFAALEISASHPQITYYFFFVLLALAISEGVRAVRKKRLPAFLKTTGALLLAGVLAIGANLIQLYYNQEYSKDSMRGGSELTEGGRSGGLDKAYATEWSYGKMETLDLFIPNFVGGSSSHGFSADGPVAQALTPYNARNMAPHLPGYWGEQLFTEGPVYIGAVVVFLFVFGMFLLGGYKKWWIFGVTVLSILLAWGHNLMWFTDLFFDYVPLYNKFRTVSMILVIAEFTLPLLGILALQKVWSGEAVNEKLKRSLKYALCITGGVALFFALLGSSLFSFTNAADGTMGLPDDVLSAMRSERASMLRADAFRSLIFVLLSAGIVWLFYRGKIKKGLFVAAFATLVIVDMVGVDARFVNHDSFMPKQQATGVQPTAADRQILADPEPGFRVANFTVSPFQDATTSYFHRSVGGYHGAKLGRYQDLIERQLSKMNPAVYNMLNTKYFISFDEQKQPVAQLNPEAMGAAWFVRQMDYVPDANAEMAALDDFDPGQTAFVDERFRAVAGEPGEFATDSTAAITLTDYKVNHLTYKYSASEPQLAVFSEIYYPRGWTATVDGVETPFFRTDYILRAMRLPAGEHTVEFRYAAPHFAMLKRITMASSGILLAGLALVLVLALVCKRKEEAPASDE
jgi:hypothetical protein